MKRDKTLTWRRVDPSTLDLGSTKVAIVGGTGGIGRALSRFMASHGASVLVVGQTFRDAGVPGIEFIKADLSLMREAVRIAPMLPAESLDLVVFTTGIFAAPEREETAEGIERDLAVSYLSRLAIVREIAPRLGKQRPAKPMNPRVFVMGYPGTGRAGVLDDLNSEKSYRAWTAHQNTIAGNEALVLDAAERYPNMSVFGLNPGLIRTNIRSNFLGAESFRFRFLEAFIGLLSPSADTYTERLTPLLVSPDLEGHSGAIFDRKNNAILPSAKLRNASYRKAFIAASEALMARAKVDPSAF